MRHAHQFGIIHRDLKPGNILVDKNGQPRILGFGPAKFTMERRERVETISSLSRTGQFLGSLAWASPEQIEEAPDGDRTALHELLARHGEWIFHVAFKLTRHLHDAEDVAQEVSLTLLTKIGSFRRKSAFRTWLYRIIFNCPVNVRQKSGRENAGFRQTNGRESRFGSPFDPPDMESPPVDHSLMLEEFQKCFRTAIPYTGLTFTPSNSFREDGLASDSGPMERSGSNGSDHMIRPRSVP